MSPDTKVAVTVDGRTLTLTNLAKVLDDAGARMSDVVTATLYLVDMGDYVAANEVWIEAFGDHRPARTAVAVAGLPLGARCEVAAWAWVGAT